MHTVYIVLLCHLTLAQMWFVDVNVDLHYDLAMYM